MPVVDDEQRVIGVVSERDLLFKLENPAFFTLRDRLRHLFGDDSAHRKAHASNLTELMSTPPVTINDETSLGQVATLLLQRKINRVPVVDDADKLIGIISRADLVRVLHQQQESDWPQVEQTSPSVYALRSIRPSRSTTTWVSAVRPGGRGAGRREDGSGSDQESLSTDYPEIHEPRRQAAPHQHQTTAPS